MNGVKEFMVYQLDEGDIVQKEAVRYLINLHQMASGLYTLNHFEVEYANQPNINAPALTDYIHLRSDYNKKHELERKLGLWKL
jgi:hypothetical protein